jgi:hypothetical protein
VTGKLEGYLAGVLDSTDRVLFEEAIGCAKASSLRAAYIMVWLSCAESLKRRFKIASARDGAAALIEGEIQRKENNQQAVDAYLLTKAHEYGFLTDAEVLRLEHVYKMRCLYGHPYEIKPSEEDLVAAAAAVVELVLSRPVKLRHGFLTEQVRLLLKEVRFLDDYEPAVAEYAREIMPRVDGALWPWFLEKLWVETEAIIADSTMQVCVQRSLWFSTCCIKELSPTVLAGWDLRQDLTATPITAAYVLSDPAIFVVIPPHAQDIVIGNLIHRTRTRPTAFKQLQALSRAMAFSERQWQRYKDAVASFSPEQLSSVEVELELLFDSLMNDLKSGNWYAQNPAIRVIRNRPSAEIFALTPEQQTVLGNNILQCAEGTAGSAVEYIKELAAGPAPLPEPLVAGLVTECFVNEQNEIRFKTLYMKEAIQCLKHVPPSLRQPILDDVVSRISKGKPKSGYWMKPGRTETFAVLKGLVEQFGESADLSALLLAVEAVPPSEDER